MSQQTKCGGELTMNGNGTTTTNNNDYEKENDSGIEKDDSTNTLLVRVAINDQNLQVHKNNMKIMPNFVNLNDYSGALLE
jgi:hypothetical protein